MSNIAIVIKTNSSFDRCIVGARAIFASRPGNSDRHGLSELTVRIPIDLKHRPLIRYLDRIAVGRFCAWTCDWRIGAVDLTTDYESLGEHMGNEDAALAWLAQGLRNLGFDVTTQDDDPTHRTWGNAFDLDASEGRGQ